METVTFTFFTKIVRTLVPQITDEQFDQIAPFVKFERLHKNTLLVQQGEVCKKIYFLHTGCIRNYFLNHKGQEKTRVIFMDVAIATAFLSFLTGQPSLEFTEVLEDSDVLFMGREEFFRLTKEIPEWEIFYVKILESTYVYQNRRLLEMLTLPAKDRYLKLLNDTPHYLQRISNRVLSTFLDISQETLSRLKSNS